MKRVVTLQDLSCAGKCSIAVALPVLSCLDAETVVIPTSLLSNHTAFESFKVYDLSDMIQPLSEGLSDNNIGFDAIYTGYIGSRKQIGETEAFIKRFHNDGVLLVVDPAMADDGQIYAGLPDDFSKDMLSLVSMADVIIPNITEAHLLLGKDYRAAEELDSTEIREMLRMLSDLGPKKIIITGVHSGSESIGAMCFDRDNDSYSISVRKKHAGFYLGTGDIFASVVTGCLMKGQPLDIAMDNAVDFVGMCIGETESDPEKRWYGVSFEKCLHLLHGYISD